MVIRPSVDTDLANIVTLLKTSLGESLIPKSENYWRWKHVHNPFGQSPVLVAEEGGEIVGVRAFMRWRWTNRTTTIEALRAVDTATHPQFQGKGIFSKLTKSLIEYCNDQKWNMIYNTPNTKSMPGYLKMGWVKAGRMPVDFKVVRPMSVVFNVLSKHKTNEPTFSDTSVPFFLNHPGLQKLLTTHKEANGELLSTSYSLAYLKWRYLTNPVAAYYAVGVENGNVLDFLMIYRLKSTRLGLELRITDLFYSSRNQLETISSILDRKMKEHEIHLATISSNDLNEGILTGFFRLKRKSFGPIVTVRDIAPGGIIDFLEFKNWSPSLGDMELF
jgi:GNAT superfamily N-acetyltransferase